MTTAEIILRIALALLGTFGVVAGVFWIINPPPGD
jgi:nitrate reductase NapE component